MKNVNRLVRLSLCSLIYLSALKRTRTPSLTGRSRSRADWSDRDTIFDKVPGFLSLSEIQKNRAYKYLTDPNCNNTQCSNRLHQVTSMKDRKALGKGSEVVVG